MQGTFKPPTEDQARQGGQPAEDPQTSPQHIHLGVAGSQGLSSGRSANLTWDRFLWQVTGWFPLRGGQRARRRPGTKATIRLLWEPNLFLFVPAVYASSRPGSRQVGTPMLLSGPGPVQRLLQLAVGQKS